MIKDDRDAPDELKGFVPRPAPPHLRRKVLAAAGSTQPASRFLTAAQWGMAAACALLIVGALAGDALISKSLAGRLDVLLNERPAASQAGDADRVGLEELVGVDRARSMRLQSNRPRHDRVTLIESGADGNDSNWEGKEGADVHTKNPQ